jgi:lambda family phage minor tail protein L
MPAPLSTIAITEKNKLANADSVFLIALKIEIPGMEEDIRVVANTENIAWRGYDWIAFPFDLDEVTETDSGEVPQVDVKVSNVSREMEYYVHEYDSYCKQNGFEPIICKIYVINTLNLDSSEPERELTFELVQPKTDTQWVTFTLGASNPFQKRFPRRRMLPSCPWEFEGPRCGFDSRTVSSAKGPLRCNKTFQRCKELGNAARFGGFYATGRSGI